MTDFNYMDITEIRQKYDQGGYEPEPITIPDTVPENHVFDENMSVKWNRDQVEKHNREVKNLRIEERNREAHSENMLRTDVVNYIRGVYKFTAEQAAKIESEVYADKHSCISDYFYGADRLAELIRDVIDMKK